MQNLSPRSNIHFGDGKKLPLSEHLLTLRKRTVLTAFWRRHLVPWECELISIVIDGDDIHLWVAIVSNSSRQFRRESTSGAAVSSRYSIWLSRSAVGSPAQMKSVLCLQARSSELDHLPRARRICQLFERLGLSQSTYFPVSMARSCFPLSRNSDGMISQFGVVMCRCCLNI